MTIDLEDRIRQLERTMENEISALKTRLRQADRLLKNFARVADCGDHFEHTDSKPICSWRINGQRIYGPTMADCRAARAFIGGET